MAFEYGESYYGLRTFGSSAGDVKDASATVSVATTIVSSAIRVRIAGALVSVTSSTASVGEEFILEESSAFTYGSGLYGVNLYSDEVMQITATSSITCSAESFSLKSSDEFDYGTGLYGANQYGSEDLQTIVSATSSIANVAGVRVQFGSATVSAVASITSVAEKINLSSGTTTATSTITASGAFSVVGDGTMTSTATISATCNKVHLASSIVSVTSGTATIGREKWEIISVTPITWTPVVNDSVTWTQIAA